MDTKVLDWLLEQENPSVRYYALTTLLKKPFDSAIVIEAKQAIMTEGIVPELLFRGNEDGIWGEADAFYTDKYKGTSWVLLMLAELGADGRHPKIEKACEFMFNYSQEPVMGGFSYRTSKKTGGGLASVVVPCLTANMVYALVRLGYVDDPRLQKAVQWITTYQRADDGIEIPPSGEPYNRYEMCWGRHTCHMGAAKALKALAAIPPEKRSNEVVSKIDELAEYFLKHHIFKKSHELEKVSRPGWLKFRFPLMYQTDVLEILDILVSLGIHDERMEEALALVAEKKGTDGTWLVEDSYKGKLAVEFEKRGKPSKWITLKALRVSGKTG